MKLLLLTFSSQSPTRVLLPSVLPVHRTNRDRFRSKGRFYSSTEECRGARSALEYAVSRQTGCWRLPRRVLLSGKGAALARVVRRRGFLTALQTEAPQPPCARRSPPSCAEGPFTVLLHMSKLRCPAKLFCTKVIRARPLHTAPYRQVKLD